MSKTHKTQIFTDFGRNLVSTIEITKLQEGTRESSRSTIYPIFSKLQEPKDFLETKN